MRPIFNPPFERPAGGYGRRHAAGRSADRNAGVTHDRARADAFGRQQHDLCAPDV
jgi:hypothetical protein